MLNKVRRYRFPAAGAALLCASVLVMGCGSDSLAPPPPPPPPAGVLYLIERPRLETIGGSCPDSHGTFVGAFEQNGDQLVFNAMYNGNPSLTLHWAGTVDEAMNFDLSVLDEPFSLNFEAWTAKGSFSADESTLTGSEYFRGILSDGAYCEGIVGWVGKLL